MSIELKSEELAKFYRIRIALSRKSFWQFCVTSDPDFYKPDRKHLTFLCETLQALYEGRVVRRGDEHWRLLDPEEDLAGLERCKRLIVNMPPRMGKTRTLTLFQAWVLGRNPLSKFVVGSYNDDAAADISRYVRDAISAEPQGGHDIVYSDIFPMTKLKGNDKSVSRWAVEGSYFTYIGTGPGGTATGKGADFLIVDDPVKNSDTAFNAPAMKKINSWVMNTLLSRKEANAFEIIVHTRWPNGDLTSAYQNNPKDIDKKEWRKFFVIAMAAEDENGNMLCEDILSRDDYESKRINMDSTIFEANYNQKIIRPEGALYKEFKTYTELPKDEDGNPVYDRAIAFVDTADAGEDFLCAITGIVVGNSAYVTDVLYTQEGVETSLPLCADLFATAGTLEARIESNSGGKAYAKDLNTLLTKDGHNVYIEESYQTHNKQTRILSNAALVQQRILMPSDWETRFPQYALDMMQFLRIGRNAHDDAPDATTGFYEFAFDGGVVLA